MKWNKKGFVLPTLLIGLVLLLMGLFFFSNQPSWLSGEELFWFAFGSIVLGAAIIGFSVFGWWGAVVVGGIAMGILIYDVYLLFRGIS